MADKKKKEQKINKTLLNYIAPIGLKFKRASCEIGDNKARVYGITRYPAQLEYGWAAKITNIPSSVCTISYTPLSSPEFLDAVQRDINNNRTVVNTSKNDLEIQRARTAAENGEKIMKAIDQDGEKLGLMSTLIMPYAADDEAFDEIAKKAESKCAAVNLKFRTMSNLQREGFKQISAQYDTDPDIRMITDKVMPMSAFVGGFPFSSSGFSDGQGYYLAKDANGGLVIIDPWLRGGDRTNCNWVCMGIPGMGKSTAIKHIMISEFMRGTKLLVIDPHGEYRELCKNLNGDWINLAGGKTKINPLQVRLSPRDEDEKEEEEISDVALYIRNLDTFFKLYNPAITERLKAILKDCIIECYARFNITWTTDITRLRPEDFPIMSDLYDVIAERAENSEYEFREECKELKLYLQDISSGADSFLWNGTTNINPQSRIIDLDIKALMDAPDNIKATQYYNMLQWAWEEIIRDPEERVLLVCDEAYLMIDRRTPQSISFLRNVSKGARKASGGLMVISHSVVDFLDESVKLYGQAILDNANFKIIMGTDGQNLLETKKLFDLTDAEEELISGKRRGHALAKIGAKKIHVRFDIPDYKFQLFGSAGGQ